MGYRTLKQCLDDLSATGQLVRIESEVDPRLEAAEIHRRVYQAGGPAVFYAHPARCRFPLVSNLFGTIDRARFIFRDSLDRVRRLIELRADPTQVAAHPLRYARVVPTALSMRPKRVSRGAILAEQTTIDQLPQVVSWPDDGGAFITLGQVYTEDADKPGFARSNLGMYRVQLSGGSYEPNREVGLHYQIHRGIGVHHAAAIRHGERLRANVFVGGPPAITLAAVMPLPERFSELAFAGALAAHRMPMICRVGELPIHAEADFCISGYVHPDKLLREGPFGDHLGYYSLAHDFPVLCVERVFHRRDAVWPFTVVGRPPQEDTVFGCLIHELTEPVVPTLIPGVRAVHAVDASGVHPLLLAVGSERYVPYAERRRPQELLTQANAILGQGQMSLAKYLFIVAAEDDPRLDIHDVAAFFRHVLKRVDWTRDLHFQTRTTIDTLDYSGSGLNEGSKVVVAAVGPPRRNLATDLSRDLALPPGFGAPRLCLPGIVAIQGPPSREGDESITPFCDALSRAPIGDELPLWVVADDSEFAARTLENFLWVTFTRSDPAADIHGVGEFINHKHWGCRGPLVIDARRKPHHAPPLIEDAVVRRRVEALAAPGGPLHGII